MFERYTEISTILIGMSVISLLVYWATHFRRELTVTVNLVDCVGSFIGL
jgi:hypothetical protein